MIFFLYSILFFSALSVCLGFIVNFVTYRFHIDADPIIEKIDELLPQTQCAQCDYPGCYSYAVAIVEKNEKIDKCIPGGNETVLKIANLLNDDTLQYDNLNSSGDTFFKTAVIDEENCVGCSKCRLICPVDAIIGTYNFTHTVVKNMCTGCNLCISLCPTNCIREKITYNENFH
ncbi:electron transport complex protein RnfB [Buchnera aphidicola (Schlechtendalia chinensis)]|uniref:Ion-translocating oxidoreductase complex subunit B n=1 Tax=Buchnera aphidicola subsp. Schlechtendalia chinensis TaxID=118110 RepID=A0A172WD90_BUCSC|nr:RnfABCDGE type electron transport complex subunit B [Buchnera aphidicola]ANF16921.1 electron transport complex protein RnfB [Buchnera aphidicola (Schlechtendalia chinensis)]